MGRVLRWFRGVLGTAAVWAVGFGVVGSAVTLMSGYGLAGMASAFLPNAICGFVLGGTFAGILSFTERKRTLVDLSIPRVGLWGAIGTMLLAPGMTTGMVEYAYAVVLGAAFAGGSVALAKRETGRKAIGGAGGTVLGVGPR